MTAPARLLRAAPPWAHDAVVLDHDARLIRRKRLETVSGRGFLVDLPQLTDLASCWGFELPDGTCVQVIAAEEELVQITGPNLPRLAWHIGNRHTPCQIEPDRLLIRRDPVIEAMLIQQGAILTPVCVPFAPEGGAYGHGRTMGHSHGPDADERGDAGFGWHRHGDAVPHRHGPKDGSGPR